MQHLTETPVWSQIAAFAAAVAVLAGLFANLGKLKRWAVARLEARRARKDAPVQALKAIKDFQRKQDAINADQQRQLDEIKGLLGGLDEQVATVQRERMTWAYTYYGEKKKPLPMMTKTAFCDMYDQYTGHHNHIPADFKQKINAAPSDD